MHIDYVSLVSRAMREVVKEAVKIAAITQQCNFFITVNTSYEGVVLPLQVKMQYPEEINIILEHQFSDLTVYDDYFSLQLSFNDVSSEVIIPFSSLLYFLDRENKFSMKFKKEERIKPPKEKSNKIIYLDTRNKKKEESPS